MGIKKLNKYLLNHNSLLKHKNLQNFKKSIDMKKNRDSKEPLVLGIDTSLYLYKYRYSYDNFLFGFIIQITKMLSSNIIPLYILDGNAPIEKADILKYRNEKKQKIKNKIILLKKEIDESINLTEFEILNEKINKLNKQIISITKNNTNDLLELLRLLNIPFINAIGEADSMCVKLYKENIIDACLSDDMDILVAGCKNMIKFEKSQVLHYDLDYILNNLDINYNRFVDMCVIFGCDYIKPIPHLDCNIIYKLIKTNMILEDIIEFLNKIHIQPRINSIINDSTFSNIDINLLANYYRNSHMYLKARNIYLYSHKKEKINNFYFNKKICKIKKNTLLNFINVKIIYDKNYNKLIKIINNNINIINNNINSGKYSNIF